MKAPGECVRSDLQLITVAKAAVSVYAIRSFRIRGNISDNRLRKEGSGKSYETRKEHTVRSH